MLFQFNFCRLLTWIASVAKLLNIEKKPGQDTPPKNIDPETVRTAPNDLDFALRALSTISSSIPLGGTRALSGILPLLEITGRIEQTPANAQGLAQLAARIEHITPIVNEMAHMNASKGQTIVQELQQELASITQDLKDACSKGKLDQFFGSADKGSPLERHNTVLATLIADSTLVTVNEVLRSLRKIEGPKLQESSSSKSTIILGDLKGELGSPGDYARIGGKGGEGEGPHLEMDPNERYRIGNISGGTGGNGGNGIEVGGKGGTGKGPTIMLRRSEPQ
ncbi:hypothetical protein DFH08DRAFT_805862 [Mycena albidolilacea]|uniref:NACHT-NTPase and P-loop NTPases N-terminal domain-containing protein n=1 Tax=Mycena albidolilacea TaxID=1033008 RepID=A0AAD7EV30_9AGAR|nr:hypothetical protein DFH08DRAFT_805862 [Mycena albidolilacea]